MINMNAGVLQGCNNLKPLLLPNYRVHWTVLPGDDNGFRVRLAKQLLL